MFDSQQDKTDQALSHYLKAFDIFETIQDSTGIATTLHNLGMFYSVYYKDYTKSKQYFKSAISIKKLLNDKDDLGGSYQMLANTFYYQKQYDSALVYTDKAKAIMTSKRLICVVNTTIAAIHYRNGEFEKAIKIYKENITNLKANNDQKGLSSDHTNIAFLLLH